MKPAFAFLTSFGLTLACGSAGPSADELALDIGQDLVQIGYGAPFSIQVRAPRFTARPEIRWAQIAGAPLLDVVVSNDGYRFSARTPLLGDLLANELPWGVIPLSPRTRGEAVLEAEWRDRGGATVRRQISVTAAARSRGLPNVPLGQRLYLGGAGWHVVKGPAGATATVEDQHGVDSFMPDTRGTWDLGDGNGRTLRLQSGRYDETPLDCGRAGCHAELSATSANTPMTWAFARRLEGHAPAERMTCALACHATGEPGTHDGGFMDVAAELSIAPAQSRWRAVGDLPRPLRRLGSVGCLACHGPTALPEEQARWGILRSDVCAYCHDAPPRYGHVASWRSSAMARADRDPEAASSDACVGCHTTWGFFGQHAADTGADANVQARRPPDGVGNVGIACAVCHAVHGGSGGSPSGLLRQVRLPELFDGVAVPARARIATCVACHAPVSGDPLARASGSAIWAGRGGLDPETAMPIEGPGPHLEVPGGCLGCHDGGPSVERGSGHGFRANFSRCTSCHDAPPRDASSIAADAGDLWKRLRELGVVSVAGDATSRPIHATDKLAADPGSALARAAYDLSLILEDKAFFAHNLPYARMLLEAAKKAIETPRARRGDQL